MVSNTTLLGANTDGSYACYASGQTYINSQGQSASCTAADVLSSGQRTTLVNNVLPAAIAIINSILQVNQPTGNLFLDANYYSGRKSCNQGIPIPASYVTGGVGIPNADYFVWVTARPAASTQNLASALACNIVVVRTAGPKYGRPLAGYINFNPAGLASVDLTNSLQYNRYVRVAVHEMMHALGFSSQFYAHYVNDNGQFYTQPTQTVTMRGNSVALLKVPRVVKFGQLHYNCASLTGMELEDYGGAGTAGSHWELRLGNNEIMTGYADAALIISNLTLSLFRDMGWYQVNWGQAEPFVLGYQQGCSFALEKCNTWTQPRTFCTTANAAACTIDRLARGYCDKDTGQTIPTNEQYFAGDPTAGGNPARDFCPFVVGYSNTYCADSAAFRQHAYEALGNADSRCFEVQDGGATQACLRQRCTGSTLEILMGATWVACNSTAAPWPGTPTRTVTCDPLLCNGPLTNSADIPIPPPLDQSGVTPDGAPAAGVASPGGRSEANAISAPMVLLSTLVVLSYFAL